MSFCTTHSFEYGSPECPMCHDEGLLSDFEDIIPSWAEKRIGSSLEIRAQLMTRDGRRCGNAVIFNQITKTHGKNPIPYEYWECVTDAGTIMTLNENEVRELFHRPLFVVKQLLPYPAQMVKEYQHGNS